MSDEEAETIFRQVRWPTGKTICPHCQCDIVYECRRPSGALRFRCKACPKDFSITSGTLFAHHKLPMRIYLAAIAIFLNEVKGKSALALSRDLDVQYKTAFVLSHKLRQAMASELTTKRIAKTANSPNHNGKRQVVIVMRGHSDRTQPAVLRSSISALWAQRASLGWTGYVTVTGPVPLPFLPYHLDLDGYDDPYERQEVR